MGCGGSKKSTDEIVSIDEIVGNVSRSEFEKLSPTYTQFSKAYNRIKSQNPNINVDSVDFPRILFDQAKLETRSSDTKSRNFLDTLLAISWEEWKVITANLGSAMLGINTKPDASSSAEIQYPCDIEEFFHNNKADAVRHAYWNALMAKRAASVFGLEQGLLFAEKMATAHEIGSVNIKTETAMDLSNNATGRRIFKENPNASDEQLLQLIASLPFEYFASDAEIPLNDSRLAYFEGKRTMDGSWSGSFTNPDSGGPWQTTYYFNQCGKTIRGEFHGTRGTDKAKRRFTGTITGDKIELDISYPFEWEIANPNSRPCENTRASITVSSQNISGGWVSSTCRLGGSISLTKDGSGRSYTILSTNNYNSDVCSAPISK
jgi:hypothetical protein